MQLNYAVKESKQNGFPYGIRTGGRETCPIVENRLRQIQGQGSLEKSKIKMTHSFDPISTIKITLTKNLPRSEGFLL